MLVRPATNGTDTVEVYMVRRNEALQFLGGFYVFPGGKLEEEDFTPESFARCRGLSPDTAESIIHLRNGVPSLGYWIGALRELFEEAGVLFALDQEGHPINSAMRPTNEWRQKLLEGESLLTELLQIAGWYYDVGSLRYVSHWVTPPGMPRRYDTRFFLCPMPPHQEPSLFRGEHVDACWISPREALDRLNRGEMPIFPVTEVHLHDLMSFKSWDSLFPLEGGHGPLPNLPQKKIARAKPALEHSE